MRTFLIADPSPNLPLREVFLVDWASDPSSLRVGALVELFKNDKPSARPLSTTEFRKENTFLEVA